MSTWSLHLSLLHTGTPAEISKPYDVLVNGKKVGQVRQEICTTYRMAGRLIAKTFRSKKWQYSLIGQNPDRLYYSSRKRALDELMLDLAIVVTRQEKHPKTS